MFLKTYLVGGAVRDLLLGLPITEKDYVVVGSTPEAMISLNFKPVGKDFPVFLHPETHEEYALARTERKIKAGYHGFEFYTAESVTLEEDLARRDLTINAMALDEENQLIDPFHGKRDLENRILRHVSPAFSEDPVRVLRLARFAARFHHLGFRVAEETLALAKKMCLNGELNALVAERVWQETLRALGELTPSIYFQVLRACGALAILFPELDALFEAPASYKNHGELALKVLDLAAHKKTSSTVRFAVLTFFLNKALGEFKSSSLKPLEALVARYKISRYFYDVARLLVMEFPAWLALSYPQSLLDFFDRCDAWRRPERFKEIILACEIAYEVMYLSKSPHAYDCPTTVEKIQLALKNVTLPAGLSGPAIKDFYQAVKLALLEKSPA